MYLLLMIKIYTGSISFVNDSLKPFIEEISWFWMRQLLNNVSYHVVVILYFELVSHDECFTTNLDFGKF